MKPISTSAIYSLLFLLSISSTSATPVSSPKIHPIRNAEPQYLGRYVCPPGTPLGSLACTTETSYVICSDWTAGSIVMPVAAGTVCRDNRIMAAAPFVPAVKADPAPAPMPTLKPAPADVKLTLVQAPKSTIYTGNGHVVILPIN